jgi:hypothetical protein
MDPNLIKHERFKGKKRPGQIWRDGANGVIEIITKKNKPLKSALKKSKQN